MFRNVPECSGMFHVPGFIDGRQNDEKPHTAELDDTTIPQVKIKITEIPHEKKPNTAIP